MKTCAAVTAETAAHVQPPLPQAGVASGYPAAPQPALTQGPILPRQPTLPKGCTWESRSLSSGFQDTGQGLEEDTEGLGPQGLWTEHRGHGKCCSPALRQAGCPPTGPSKSGAEQPVLGVWTPS